MRKILLFLIFFLFTNNNLIAKENIMILKLKDGDVEIQLFPDVAPNHVERIKNIFLIHLRELKLLKMLFLMIWD